MQRKNDAVLFPYTKPAKQQLVDFINLKNNRLFSVDQLIFGIPAAVDGNGLSRVSIGFAVTSSFTNETAVLEYWRVDLKKIVGESLTIWVDEHTPQTLYKAILEQYGVLIEPELFSLTETTVFLPDIAPVTDLAGFDPVDDPVTQPVVSGATPVDNRNYRLTALPHHLTWFGSVTISTRRALKLLGTTIDSTLDLREFYKDGRFEKPPVELVTPNGVWLLDDVMDEPKRRHFESLLFTTQVGDVELGDSLLVELLTAMTGDRWVNQDTLTEFNLRGSEIVYNGFVTKDYQTYDDRYGYVIAIALGPLCDNLTGLFKIAYRYASSLTPSNLDYDRSHVMPIFGHGR